jgi:hypothetical protein
MAAKPRNFYNIPNPVDQFLKGILFISARLRLITRKLQTYKWQVYYLVNILLIFAYCICIKTAKVCQSVPL